MIGCFQSFLRKPIGPHNIQPQGPLSTGPVYSRYFHHIYYLHNVKDGQQGKNICIGTFIFYFNILAILWDHTFQPDHDVHILLVSHYLRIDNNF